MIAIIFPSLNFFRITSVQKIVNLSIFAEENKKLTKEFDFGRILLFGAPLEPLPFKIIGTIENGMLSWPTTRISEIMLTIILK